MVVAKQAGIVKFSLELIAHNVLFVPDFNLNFLFVPKLCLDIDYIVVFYNNKCLIKEKRSLRMISSADLIDGLYFLAAQDTPQATIASPLSQAQPDIIFIPKYSIWNFKLGHLSNKKLLILHHNLPFVTIDKK